MKLLLGFCVMFLIRLSNFPVFPGLLSFFPDYEQTLDFVKCFLFFFFSLLIWWISMINFILKMITEIDVAPI